MAVQEKQTKGRGPSSSRKTRKGPAEGIGLPIGSGGRTLVKLSPGVRRAAGHCEWSYFLVGRHDV